MMWITMVLVIQWINLYIQDCRSKQIITVDNNFVVPVLDMELADMVDWRKHPCRRECRETELMKCHYTFKLEGYTTMSKACFDCPNNMTDCFRPHCIPTDGIKRPISVINRQLPGPSIEVCKGDRVIVDVMNLLPSESTTMHWHGQHQRLTPYMDGVPHISQCPISPGSTFRYDFYATEIGTHFWHSHIGFQRGDGAFGSLIVRVPPKTNPHKNLYDVDEHTFVILDWAHVSGVDMFLDHHHADGDNKPPNILVNGFGRFGSIEEEGNNNKIVTPLATFNVKQNLRYRFRLINAEFLNCPVELSVDNHTLLVISSDGQDIEPIEAESLVSYAGERFDFIINTNQKVNNYWIRVQGLMDCDERFTKAFQSAILRYEGADNKDPEGEVTYDSASRNSSTLQINSLNKGTETNNSVSIPLLNAIDNDDESNTNTPDYQFYVSYDFYEKDNPHFHRKNLYGFHQIKDKKNRVLTPQLNHISMKFPPFPIMSQRDLIDPNNFCNSTTIRGCENEYCTCTHVLQVKLNSVVELVLVDEGVAYDANHPFHLHGYLFRVIAMERVASNTTVEEIKKLDQQGRIHRKLKRAPLKDTVTVPDGGYTIIRFHAKNPGYWLFHCHIEFHAEVGMALIFKIGEHEDFQPVPNDFPRCGDYKPQRYHHQSVENLPSSTVRMTVDNNFLFTHDPNENEINNNHSLNKVSLLELLTQIIRDLKDKSSSRSNSVISIDTSLFFISFFTSVFFISQIDSTIE